MKVNNLWIIVACILLSVAACSAKYEAETPPVPASGAEGQVWKLQFKGNPGTRTAFGEYEAGNPLPFVWLRGDGVGLFLSKDGNPVESGQNLIAVLEKGKGGLNGGSFVADITGLSGSTFYDVQLYYPWRYLGGSIGEISGRVTPHQLQKAPGSSAHIGKCGGFAVATTSFSTPSEGKTVSNISFELDHKTSYVWFEVSAAAGNYSGWKLKRITLSAPNDCYIAGATTYDTATSAFTLDDAASRSSSITLDIENAAALSSTAQSAYMVVFPTAVASKTLSIAYTLTNPAGTSTVTLSHDKVIGGASAMFAPGKAYRLVEEIPSTAGGGWTETPYTTIDEAACREAILSILTRANLPSISLTYQDNLEKVSFSVVNEEFYEAQGRSSEGAKINENAIYEAASVSKVPFAYVAMKIYDEGDLDLDKPLYEYWPELLENFVESAREDAKLVTARHCLLHTSGMPNGGWSTSMDFNASALPVGSKILYSGQALCVLSKVLEVIKGQEFSQIAKAYVFDKLGMNTTTYLYSDYSSLYSNLHTYGYPDHTRHTSWTTGVHATLRTNSLQFNEFLQWFLHGADLSPEGYEEMMRDYVRYNTNNIRTLGWFVEHHEELGPIFWHNGINGGGFRSWAFLIPECGITLSWFVNATYSYNIQAPLFNLFVGNKTAVGTLGGMTPLPSGKVGDAGSSPVHVE